VGVNQPVPLSAGAYLVDHIDKVLGISSPERFLTISTWLLSKKTAAIKEMRSFMVKLWLDQPFPGCIFTAHRKVVKLMNG
jgi:hypothetical protein